jgi:hypothetical protein
LLLPCLLSRWRLPNAQIRTHTTPLTHAWLQATAAGASGRSPLLVVVRGANTPFSAVRCVVAGDGLARAVAGRKATVDVTAVDSEGVPMVSGGRTLRFKLDNQHVRCPPSCRHSSFSHASSSPRASSSSHLNTPSSRTLANQRVLPALASRLTSPARAPISASTPIVSHLSPTPSLTPHAFPNPRAHTHTHTHTHCVVNALLSQLSHTRTNLHQVDDGTVRVTDYEDGRYLVEYVITVAGFYSLIIVDWDGGTERSLGIGRFPATIRVFPAATAANMSYVDTAGATGIARVPSASGVLTATAGAPFTLPVVAQVTHCGTPRRPPFRCRSTPATEPDRSPDAQTRNTTLKTRTLNPGLMLSHQPSDFCLLARWSGEGVSVTRLA